MFTYNSDTGQYYTCDEIPSVKVKIWYVFNVAKLLKNY
jgi:hypothetical protein